MIFRRRRNNARAIETRLDALKSDFQALQHDIRGLADSVNGAAADLVLAADTTAESALENADDWSNANIGRLRDTVRTQKLASMMLAMGVGTLIGALLLRR